MDELEKIVRDLAEGSVINGYSFFFCLLCQADDPDGPEDHEPDCPWRRAKEFAQAHPASPD